MSAMCRINAVVLRYTYLFRRSLDRLTDAVYWPVLDLVLWGVTTKWLSTSGGQTSNMLLVMLTAIVFWQIVWRAKYEIAVNLLEEFWNQNLVNLFSSPLRVREWVLGVMAVGVLKTSATIVVGLTASWMLYSLNIFEVGYLFVPFMVLLIIFGWAIGFVAAGFIIYFGQRIQTVAWTLGWMLAPFSAVYYPLEQLPGWGRAIGKCLPTTYVFEGMRLVLNHERMPLSLLGLSAILAALYLAASVAFFAFMFEKSRVKGLQRPE